MNKLKNNFMQNIILIILIIFFFSNKTDFVKNTHFIISKNYDERINSVYGFCSPEGIGYLRNIKKKFNLKENPKIINYEHVPQNNWAILNTSNIGQNSNKLIFLNYPGTRYEINLNKSNEDMFELKDVEFIAQNFESISEIRASNYDNFENEKIKLEIFTIDKSLNKKIIENIELKKNKNEQLNLIFKNLNLSESKLFFKLRNINQVKNINITLQNKYDLKNFKIINKHKNCYFVEKL